jgi:hypothetical protein
MKSILLKSLLLITVLAQHQVFALPFPTNWQPIMSCDGGSAVVDVNTYERRMLQLVIKNEDIYKYISSNNELYGSAIIFSVLKKEIIVPAEVSRGVFSPEDFQGFQANAYMRPAIRVYRVGSGIKVQAVDLAHWICTNYRENDYYCADGYWTEDREVASWHFQTCANH